jgi:uncharacterized protein YhbP (UPF0306 family)
VTDNEAHARAILAETSFAVLATADSSGNPWATPVWFAADGLERIYWLSWPGSHHSSLIETRPEIALTVFDSTVAPHQGTAFYATARARRCGVEDLEGGLRTYNRRAASQGLDALTAAGVTGDARLRLYIAEILDSWVLDQDAEVDQRSPVRPGGARSWAR